MKDKDQCFKRLTKFGKLLYYTRTIDLYRIRGIYNAVFNWWNPITWAFLLIAIPYCIYTKDSFFKVIPIKKDVVL